jgi:hypothetical protein
MSEKKSMMAIAINKSLCKECSVKDSNTTTWSRVVYLENGTEFQIQLFNPHKYTIGAKIYINGERIPNILVLNPGERIWLERFLDTAKKFKFSTYEVDGNDSDVKEAIKDNGLVKVEFYKEVRKKSYLDNKITWQTYDNTNKIDYNKYKKNYSFDPGAITATLNDYTYETKSNALTGEILCSDDLCTTHTYYSKSFSEPIASASVDCITTANYSCDCTGIFTSATSITIEPETIETGRIDEGSYSTQEFQNVYKSLECFPFVTETIKLLPISQKPFTANDLQKIYCSECGRKLNTKYKFCPYCGTGVD